MSLFPGVAFVTGAGSGIGRQTAITFAAEGCMKVALADRNPSALDMTKDMILKQSPSVDVLLVPMDLRLDKDITSGISSVIEKFGRIDYAVNCAGIYGTAVASTDMDSSDFDDIMAINCRGVWFCSREEAKHMKLQEPLPTHDGRPGCRGSIINIASDLGFVSLSGRTAYCGSKAAVIHMTKTDAIDYSAHNIRVNCVAPGLTETPMSAETPNDGPEVQGILLKRKGTPQEIADVITFVSGPKASYMQGSVTLVDGGITIG